MSARVCDVRVNDLVVVVRFRSTRTYTCSTADNSTFILFLEMCFCFTSTVESYHDVIVLLIRALFVWPVLRTFSLFIVFNIHETVQYFILSYIVLVRT